VAKTKINIREVLSLNFLHRRETLVISGSVDSDANALAHALGMKAERDGVSVMTINAGMLDEEFVEGEAGEFSAVRLIGIARPKLLIIENLGVKKLAPSQAKVLARLISERISKASTIITSPYPLSIMTIQLGASTGVKSLLNSLSAHAGQVIIGIKNESATKRDAEIRKPAPSLKTVQAQ